MTDPFGLRRFVDAQAEYGRYDGALRELRAGRKRGHWIWFVFPQVAGLGRSPMSQRYAISGLAEARAYLGHPVLGPRLLECATILIELETSDATGIFGPLDAMKLRSSMTVFAAVADSPSVFGDVLTKYFDGVPDAMTTQILGVG